MNKRIEINLIDPNFDDTILYYDNVKYVMPKSPRLFGFECENIMKKINKKISNDKIQDALDIITAYFVQKGIHKIVLDIDERNEALAPAKEMTLDEIERKLGYKIKIINNKERVKNDN